MNDHYEKVIAAIPHWQPSREERTFGISVIIRICGCTFLEALDLRERLEYEGGLPKEKF